MARCDGGLLKGVETESYIAFGVLIRRVKQTRSEKGKAGSMNI